MKIETADSMPERIEMPTWPHVTRAAFRDRVESLNLARLLPRRTDPMGRVEAVALVLEIDAPILAQRLGEFPELRRFVLTGEVSA